MRSVVTSGALVVALFVSHAAGAAVAKSDAPEDTHRAAATAVHKGKSAKTKRSSKASKGHEKAAAEKASREKSGGEKTVAKDDAAKGTKLEEKSARPASKEEAKDDAAEVKVDTKTIAKADKSEKKPTKAPKVFSKGSGADDDSELVEGVDPKIAAEDTQEIADELAARQRVLAAAKVMQEHTKNAVLVAKLAEKPAKKDAPAASETKEEVHIDTSVAALETTPAKEEAKDETKETAKDAKAVAASTKGLAVAKSSEGPLAGKLVKASTHSKAHAAPKPPCLRPEVMITSHLNEEDHFALTRCDGSLAPGAVEHFSIVTRPGSAARPEMSALEMGKGEKDAGDTIAPGIRRMDASLVERLQAVVDHFTKSGKAPHVQVVSGYRPSSVGSLHASGRAMDFRLEGVRNEELVAFCKTLTDTGCGYYPNSVFVHMDVRDPGAGHVTWVDASGPGEKPHYVSAWPAPPAEMNRPKSADEGLAKLDPTLPSLPVEEHPATPLAAPSTWGSAAKTKDLGAHIGGIDGIADDETP